MRRFSRPVSAVDRGVLAGEADELAHALGGRGGVDAGNGAGRVGREQRGEERTEVVLPAPFGPEEAVT